MASLDSLKDGLTTAIGTVSEFVSEHPVGTALGAGGVVATGAGLVALGSSKSKAKTKRKAKKKNRKTGRRIKHTKRGWVQDRKRRSKQKWEVAYQKRKRRKLHSKRHSHHNKRRGKIYYARKTGQPYIILASGKAKFIRGKRRK